MVTSLHQSLAAGRWFDLPLVAQLGNIGSEVGRALAREKKNDLAQKEKALKRALELMDLTIVDRRWQSRLKELTCIREVLVDYFYGDNLYQSTPENLEKYFYFFSYAARNR